MRLFRATYNYDGNDTKEKAINKWRSYWFLKKIVKDWKQRWEGLKENNKVDHWYDCYNCYQNYHNDNSNNSSELELLGKVGQLVNY